MYTTENIWEHDGDLLPQYMYRVGMSFPIMYIIENIYTQQVKVYQ